ncbi:MAG: hypothetical protein OMM_09494 [Candidatus Magnetoglobus multicellularis str. Araruama]|uniref:Uncharacterized protein n=1 Tax=Candidatus Magnetoglobus multicellularis str. Araruama TaxID=890399 RepID=A0A1V1P3T2_9BACT|nr:MAG: hypothetical protein OMM_09494 [Candidatus Magnetoglobus multicellularis str. Araruama]
MEGSLETGIIINDADSQEISNGHEIVHELWNDAQNALGKACRYIEKIIDNEPDNTKAREWLNVLRDPEGIHRRL